MGKLKQTAPAAESPRADLVCSGQGCGWHFARDNRARRQYDKDDPSRTRTAPRSPVSMGAGRVLCDLCYDKLMFVTGKHSAIGTPMERLIRDALWPAGSERMTREDGMRAIGKYLARHTDGDRGQGSA